MRECPEKDYDMNSRRNDDNHRENLEPLGEHQRHVQNMPRDRQQIEEPPSILERIPFREVNQRNCSKGMDMSSYIYVTINGERIKALSSVPSLCTDVFLRFG